VITARKRDERAKYKGERDAKSEESNRHDRIKKVLDELRRVVGRAKIN
jgi:hypothetical protein